MIKYTISKTSILGIIILGFGLLFTIQGIVIRYHLANVKESYETAELKNGRYIECDLPQQHFIGLYYTEKNGVQKYSPYCIEDIFSSEQTYIVAINQPKNYYVPLIISREYQKGISQIFNSDDVYHIFGKIEKSDTSLQYNILAKCVGSNNKSELNQMVSTKYQIKATDLKKEKKKLYEGFALLLSGLLILIPTMNQKRPGSVQ